MKSPQLSTVRDLALIILSTAATAAAVDELRSLYRRHSPSYGPSHEFIPPPPPTSPPSVPRPAHGWLYEPSSYADTSVRVRPATAAERAASDATRHVDGTGIFALLEDNTIVRSDAPTYPPTLTSAAAAFTRYCWAAD